MSACKLMSKTWYMKHSSSSCIKFSKDLRNLINCNCQNNCKLTEKYWTTSEIRKRTKLLKVISKSDIYKLRKILVTKENKRLLRTFKLLLRTSTQQALYSKRIFPLRISSVKKLRTWSSFLRKSLMENFISCAVSFKDKVHRKYVPTFGKIRCQTLISWNWKKFMSHTASRNQQ